MVKLRIFSLGSATQWLETPVKSVQAMSTLKICCNIDMSKPEFVSLTRQTLPWQHGTAVSCQRSKKDLIADFNLDIVCVIPQAKAINILEQQSISSHQEVYDRG